MNEEELIYFILLALAIIAGIMSIPKREKAFLLSLIIGFIILTIGCLAGIIVIATQSYFLAVIIVIRKYLVSVRALPNRIRSKLDRIMPKNK